MLSSIFVCVMGSILTPDSLNECSTRALPPLVEDVGSDMEEDSFHSTRSTLQEVSEIDSLEMCQQFHKLSTIDDGESLADPGDPRGASTQSDAVGPRRSTRTTRDRLPDRYHDFRMWKDPYSWGSMIEATWKARIIRGSKKKKLNGTRHGDECNLNIICFNLINVFKIITIIIIAAVTNALLLVHYYYY